MARTDWMNTYQRNRLEKRRDTDRMPETEYLIVHRCRMVDAPNLYANLPEEEAKQWIPNESYADIGEAQRQGICRGTIGAMTEFAASTCGINVLYGRVTRGNHASVSVVEKNNFVFVAEECGAEDDPYGNGMPV